MANVNIVDGSVRQPPKLTSREEYASWERSMMTHSGRFDAGTIVTRETLPLPAIPANTPAAERRCLNERRELKLDDYMKRRRNALCPSIKSS